MDLRHTTGDSDNYAEVLAKTKELHALMSDAFKRGDWDAANTLSTDIARMYAPNDNYVATLVEYLVDTTFTRAWFDSAEYTATRVIRQER